ncbi:hypothetical protein A9Q99_14430 [Gammaproteobacteria bacterium 45_16_T64]|nr:hypothetical protein A9Q99_14430 [Gammaproteobacteria bacterium 45_16_T64]
MQGLPNYWIKKVTFFNFAKHLEEDRTKNNQIFRKQERKYLRATSNIKTIHFKKVSATSSAYFSYY